MEHTTKGGRSNVKLSPVETVRPSTTTTKRKKDKTHRNDCSRVFLFRFLGYEDNLVESRQFREQYSHTRVFLFFFSTEHRYPSPQLEKCFVETTRSVATNKKSTEANVEWLAKGLKKKLATQLCVGKTRQEGSR